MSGHSNTHTCFEGSPLCIPSAIKELADTPRRMGIQKKREEAIRALLLENPRKLIAAQTISAVLAPAQRLMKRESTRVVISNFLHDVMSSGDPPIGRVLLGQVACYVYDPNPAAREGNDEVPLEVVSGMHALPKRFQEKYKRVFTAFGEGYLCTGRPLAEILPIIAPSCGRPGASTVYENFVLELRAHNSTLAVEYFLAASAAPAEPATEPFTVFARLALRNSHELPTS